MRDTERGSIVTADGEPRLGEKRQGYPRVPDGSGRLPRGIGAVSYAASALSLLAAAIHLWVMPEHFEEWWGYGTFFLVCASAQGAYGIALLRWPGRPLLLIGHGVNLCIVALYLVTRTVGLPPLGPYAGEGVGAAELAATAAEAAIVMMLGAALLRSLPRQRAVVLLFVLALVGVSVGHLLHLMLSLTPVHHP